jgi:hypothetical protein
MLMSRRAAGRQRTPCRMAFLLEEKNERKRRKEVRARTEQKNRKTINSSQIATEDFL